MKIHVGVAVLAVGFGFVLQISSVEWIAVIICIGLVFSAEMINTALEILVDKVSPQKDPVAGKIKDISAGAVLIAAIISCEIFSPEARSITVTGPSLTQYPKSRISKSVASEYL